MDSLAWNNFAMLCEPSDYAPGSPRRAAAIAFQYMGGAKNGGINSFLTASYDLDASEVLDALLAIGAMQAAQQFGQILERLATPLPASTQDERWDLLDKAWTDDFDLEDGLTFETDCDLMQALEKHVQENGAFYSQLNK